MGVGFVMRIGLGVRIGIEMRYLLQVIGTEM